MPSGIYKRTKPVWNKGKTHPKIKGDKNPMWKGNKVGYDAIHDWVNRTLGVPKICNECGITGKLTKDGRRYLHWANKSHEYKGEKEDWVSLCHKCHFKYDRKSGWGEGIKFKNKAK